MYRTFFWAHFSTGERGSTISFELQISQTSSVRIFADIFTLYHNIIWPQVKMELDYYPQYVNILVVSRVAELLNTSNPWEFKEILEKLGTDGKCPECHPKDKVWQLCYKIGKNQQ